MKIAKQLFLLISLADIAKTDCRKRLILNTKLGMLLCARVLSLGLCVFVCPERILEELQLAISGFVFLGLFFFCFYYVSKKRIGAGDVKLLAVLGAFCGVEQGLLSAFFGAVYGLVRESIKMKRQGTYFERQIPFAPCIFWGTVTALFLDASGMLP